MKATTTTLQNLFLVAGLLWLGPWSAAAQPQGAGKRQVPPDFDTMLERFDADGDGVLAEDELPERARRHFERMDADEDGVVTRDEHSRGPRRERFERRDENGDGLLTADELPDERGAQMIERLDSDGDGAISREEMAAGDPARSGEGTQKGRRKRQ